MGSRILVRIAVAVDEYGHWSAVGADYLRDVDASDDAQRAVAARGDAFHALYWIEAEIPAPAIKGVVRRG